MVETVAGVACFAGDEVPRRRCFGRRWFRPFPAAKEAGKKGEMIRGARGFQIKAEEEQGRPVPGEELGVQEDYLLVQRASGEERRARGALYRLAEVHRRRGLRVPAGSARVAVREGMKGSGVFVGVV